VNHRLSLVLRCRMNQALRKAWKSGSAIRLLGCTIESFKLYLESRFEVDMSWQNYGKGIGFWNIDHIIPCALFDLTKSDHQRRCFHFSNLQPMWSVENSAKGAKTEAIL
jgi:Prasinovirus endonuclease VII